LPVEELIGAPVHFIDGLDASSQGQASIDAAIPAHTRKKIKLASTNVGSVFFLNAADSLSLS
jgi:hypothetical protein